MTSKTLNVCLTLLGIAMTLLPPEVPILIRLSLMFALMIYPVNSLLRYFRWNGSSLWRWVVSSAILVVVLSVVGYSAWSRPRQIAVTSPTPQGVRQRSEGANSPNIIGDNAAVNYNTANNFNASVSSPLGIDTSRFFLYERWGGEWGKSGFQIALDERRGLTATFDAGKEYRITPGVTHELPNVRLTGVKMYLKIPEIITVRLESPTRWQHADTRFGFQEYSFDILAEIPGSYGENATEPLWLTFPHPGPYVINYSITGETTAGSVFEKVDQSFTIQLNGEGGPDLSFIQAPQFPFDSAPDPSHGLDTLWIRCGIQNQSDHVLRGVQVKWMSIQKPGERGTTGLNVRLKSLDGQESISVNPGDTIYYVFAEYVLVDDATRYIQTQIPGMRIQKGRWPDRELPAEYIIVLEASSESSPRVRGFYRLTMTDRGFDFAIIEGEAGVPDGLGARLPYQRKQISRLDPARD
jgi:hypothetical protein